MMWDPIIASKGCFLTTALAFATISLGRREPGILGGAVVIAAFGTSVGKSSLEVNRLSPTFIIQGTANVEQVLS